MEDLVGLVEQTMRLVGAGDRLDLRRRLEQTRARLLDPSVRVVVVGELKQGKSQLVNALVGAPVCAVDDDVATAVPTLVRHGAEPAAVLVAAGPAGPDGEAVPERRAVPLGEVAAHVSERGNPGNAENLLAAEVALPRSVLEGGLVLVDSPGVGGLDSGHGVATLSALTTADAVLFVTDASQELTEPEVRFLRQALRVCPNVACVLTKTDLYPRWRHIAELDQAHLTTVRGDIPLIPVSSVLRLTAAREADPGLNKESGFPVLVGHLRHQVLGQAERLRRRSVANDLLFTAEHLEMALRSELDALKDPDAAPQIIAGLEAAKQQADEQRRRSSRWQTTLADGMGDLIADMDYDLRDRMRTVQREAETAIDAGDPGQVWPEFTEWLEQRVASAVSDTFVWTNERSIWLAAQVAAHFAQGQVALPTLQVADTSDVLDPVPDVGALDDGHLGVGQKILVGMRGSYGGVLMFGLLTGIAGMALINPISVGAGVLLGGKAYREDKEARLRRRRSEAKTLVRRQIDDVVFQVGKQLRDRLRLVQRLTRDHFTEIAEEQHRSLADSVAAAQRATTTLSAGREARMRQIEAELEKVTRLRRKAESLDRAAPAVAAGAR
ncbi:replication fork clamp-binding protein CrfC [Georgenia muralis]|uniref:Replication fork clamp-binding protein CrfC n=2 Tax=Georgenia muralis TaxID=154117 RepID=A0A3N4YZZ4_9MICO|nr:replication fork clamp-binding protein CrfC [Georgenia muralis]